MQQSETAKVKLSDIRDALTEIERWVSAVRVELDDYLKPVSEGGAGGTDITLASEKRTTERVGGVGRSC